MILTEKLDFLLKQNNLSKHGLANESGIPYTTIVSLFTKGYENAKLSTLKGISNFLGVTLDYLCNDEIDEISYKTSPYHCSINNSSSPTEQQLIEDYRSLTPKWQEHIRITMKVSKVSCQRERSEASEKHT